MTEHIPYVIAPELQTTLGIGKAIAPYFCGASWKISINLKCLKKPKVFSRVIDILIKFVSKSF